jgi:hypothetical protein
MLKNLCLPTLLIATFAGCSAHVSAGYRVYDPYYTDYHTWGPDEDVYYHRWLGERHYEYRDFRRLNKDRQKEYWTWRHTQPGNQPH